MMDFFKFMINKYFGVKMATFDSIEEAREFFKGDKFATNIGVQLDELDEDSCVCSLELCDDFRNAYGAVMGGAIFTLGDFAFAVLSNQLHRPTVGLQVSINYLSGVKGEKLIAKAIYRKNGRTTSVINVDIVDDTGRDIAQFIGTGYKM